MNEEMQYKINGSPYFYKDKSVVTFIYLFDNNFKLKYNLFIFVSYAYANIVPQYMTENLTCKLNA